MSVRVLALVEGQTEEGFCRELIEPFLRLRGINFSVTTMGRPRATAGVKSWEKTKKELLMLLLEDRGRHVTTMFDYYGMPRDWPGRKDAGDKPHGERASAIEEGMRTNLEEAMGKRGRHDAFIPYVQMHEFEALLFAKPEVLGGALPQGGSPDNAVRRLKLIKSQFATPEEIDDSVATAPSKRILGIAPGYQKNFHGVIAASQIGLGAIRAACPNFDAWMRRLEVLGGSSTS